MRVLFITSEVAPFSKTGGLADISAALPRALRSQGLDVRVVTPRYGFIDPAKFGLTRIGDGQETKIELRTGALQAAFAQPAESDNAAQTYFLENPSLYDRPGIYVDPFSNQDYLDNDYRFIFLSRAALELGDRIGWKPDIIHCNDWQSSLAAYYLHDLRARGELASSRSVLTLHNLAYHGLFGPETVSRIGDAEKYFYPGGPMEYYGLVNFLKIGIEFADVLNSVSPTYAQEIQSAYEFGFGLETVLRARGDEVTGILNGIDTDAWNPATDPLITKNYTSESLEDKRLNTQALCNQVGLQYDESVPVIGMISRIVGQKGFEILVPVIGELMSLPARLVVLGTGEPHYEHVLRELAAVFPGRMHIEIGYDEHLAHLIEAGADLFIMPSKYEPCGLNQMMSMRYGTLPVVRATGGLTDTVVDVDKDPKEGTGVVFSEYSSSALVEAVRRAAAHWRNREFRQRIQRNAMMKDFSWKGSARQYANLYERALSSPPRVIP